MQLVYATVVWFQHLRRHAAHFPRHLGLEGVQKHLRTSGMTDDSVEAVAVVGSHLLRRDDAWGQGNEISASRFDDEVRWEAARRVVGFWLRIQPKTLRRRVAEADYFGERRTAR